MDERAELVRMHAAGLSYRAIGRRLGVSDTAVRKRADRLGLPRRKGAPAGGCRHCDCNPPAARGCYRGLCRGCYDNPATRALYPLPAAPALACGNDARAVAVLLVAAMRSGLISPRYRMGADLEAAYRRATT